MNLFLVAWLVRWLGGIFLALVASVLYLLRPHRVLLFWPLAWICLLGFTAWQALATASPDYQSVEMKAGQESGRVLGWAHLGLWVLGLLALRQEARKTLGKERESLSFAPAGTDRTIAFSLPPLLVLAFLVAGALTLDWLVPDPWPGLLLALAAVLAYLAGALLFLTWGHRLGLRTAGLCGLCFVGLAVFGLLTTPLRDGLLPVSWRVGSGLVDGVIQMLIALCLVALFVAEERRHLHGAQQRLALSEDHFRLVFENSGVGMALLTPDGHFVHVNPAVVQLFGYSAWELQGRRLIDLAHPDELLGGISRSEQGIDLPSSLYERDRRYRHKDGRTLWVRVLRMPHRDASGRLLHLVAVFLDITERRLAEQALRDSEQRYRLHFQGAFDGLYLCRETGEFLEANPAFCRMVGYDAEELIQLRLTDVALDLPRLQQHLSTVLSKGGDRCEMRLQRGTLAATPLLLDVEISSAVLEIQGQRFLHGICRDVTERKRGLEALRRTEETLRQERDFSRQVLDTADALILVLAPDGRILRFNAKCAAVSGQREDQVRGRYFWELAPARFREPTREFLSQATAGFEAPWETAPGEERWIVWRNSWVLDPNGAVRFLIATGIDLTEQRRLEEQLRQGQKLETLGTLVGGISHDFNNQLTIILGNLHLLLEEAQLDPGHHAALTYAEAAAQRCADMTRSLLAFSRRRSGVLQAVRPERVVGELAELLRRVLPVGIELDHAPAPEPIWPIKADPTQLHQLLMNLALNARDAMPAGGRLSLRVRNCVIDEGAVAPQLRAHFQARPGHFVCLTVEDTGCGMTPEVQARIFEPFFTTKEVGKGTGLGLAMVLGIVQVHTGWITVHSTPGEGSRFEVFLPADESGEGVREGEGKRGTGTESLSSPHRDPAPTPLPRESGPATVLVVDDDEPLLRLTCLVLVRAGFQTLSARGGDEALAIYREKGNQIDVVLLDYQMPGRSGLDVMRELQALNPDVRVVFASGYMASDEERLRAAGARGVIGKPFHSDELARVLRDALAATETADC
jgi:PAS domain S-box-containing protein